MRIDPTALVCNVRRRKIGGKRQANKRKITRKQTNYKNNTNNNNNNNKIGNVLNTQLFRNSIVATCNHASIPANIHTDSCLYGVLVRRLVVVV